MGSEIINEVFACFMYLVIGKKVLFELVPNSVTLIGIVCCNMSRPFIGAKRHRCQNSPALFFNIVTDGILKSTGEHRFNSFSILVS